MKTLLVYASKHGCTEKCAQLLEGKLTCEVQLVNLDKDKLPALDAYDTVIIGGSIHVGKVQKSVATFCKNYLEVLLKKRVGLFICCANLEQVDTQMKGAFPEQLFSHAIGKVHLGHAYDFAKMNFIERKIIKTIAKIDASEEKILMENADRFAAVMG